MVLMGTQPLMQQQRRTVVLMVMIVLLPHTPQGLLL
jgi:hypothetical protein